MATFQSNPIQSFSHKKKFTHFHIDWPQKSRIDKSKAFQGMMSQVKPSSCDLLTSHLLWRQTICCFWGIVCFSIAMVRPLYDDGILPPFLLLLFFMGGFHWVTSNVCSSLTYFVRWLERWECTQVSHYTTSIPICSHGSRVHTSIGGTITTYYYFQCLGFSVHWYTNPFSMSHFNWPITLKKMNSEALDTPPLHPPRNVYWIMN